MTDPTPADIPSLVALGARFLWADAQRRLLAPERELPASRTDFHSKAEKLLDHPALLDALSPKEAELVKPTREYEVSGDAVGGGEAGVRLERWGFKWQGHDHGTHVQMPDGYWTPWHIAQAALDARAPTASHDAARDDAAQRLQDHMEQFHGVCLSASEWDAAMLAALPTTDGAC